MDKRTDGRTDRQTDGHNDGQGRPAGPSNSDERTHIDDSMELFVEKYVFSLKDRHTDLPTDLWTNKRTSLLVEMR